MFFDLRSVFLATLLIVGLGASQQAMAQDSKPVVRSTPYGTETSFGTKYNPETKSYFSLRHIQQLGGADVGGAGWPTANQVAENSTFHGVKGHLAYVLTPETHEFLLRNFGKRVSSAWIGLRHFCNGGANVWSNGKPLKPGQFSAWHPTPWLHGYATCASGGLNVAGVYYTSFEDLFRWRAAPEIHFLPQYFVEFPTGKP